MENPQLFTESKPPAKTFAHGQGETGNANRAQALNYLEALIPDCLEQLESQSICRYGYIGRKDEQCVSLLPALSFFKITRQVYRA